MNLTNVSALGSVVDALLICTCDITIGDHQYKVGEPFTYLKQVTTSIDSQSLSPQSTVATPTNRGMQLVDAINFINRIVISNVPMTNKIKSLFFKSVQGQEMTAWEPIADAQSKLEYADAYNPFVYEEGILLQPERFDLDNGWLTIDEFDEVKHYLICYNYREDLLTFVVENYPYFKLILMAEGNVNGKTSEQRLIFEKVSLMPQTQFSFGPTTQNNVTLVFGVIEPDKTVKVKI